MEIWLPVLCAVARRRGARLVPLRRSGPQPRRQGGSGPRSRAQGPCRASGRDREGARRERKPVCSACRRGAWQEQRLLPAPGQRAFPVAQGRGGEGPEGARGSRRHARQADPGGVEEGRGARAGTGEVAQGSLWRDYRAGEGPYCKPVGVAGRDRPPCAGAAQTGGSGQVGRAPIAKCARNGGHDGACRFRRAGQPAGARTGCSGPTP